MNEIITEPIIRLYIDELKKFTDLENILEKQEKGKIGLRIIKDLYYLDNASLHIRKKIKSFCTDNFIINDGRTKDGYLSQFDLLIFNIFNEKEEEKVISPLESKIFNLNIKQIEKECELMNTQYIIELFNIK